MRAGICANERNRVLHFILLIGRCCTCGPVSRSLQLRERIREEEQVLLVLMDRRRRLIEETEELQLRQEARDRPLPPIPAEDDDLGNEPAQSEFQEREEDLIDMTANEQGRKVSSHGDELGNETAQSEVQEREDDLIDITANEQGRKLSPHREV